MSFINSVLKVFVGDKSEKDVKSLQPLVKEIKSFEQRLEGLSHDELRQKTASFKAKIAEDCKEVNDKIAELQAEVENSNDIDRNEEIYSEIDKLNEEAYTISEKTLEDILPEAFAVVKETAKRFAANETLTVTASEFDRALSGDKDYVSLEGDKAVWQNSWDAAIEQAGHASDRQMTLRFKFDRLSGAGARRVIDTLGLEDEKHVRHVPNALVVTFSVFLALVIVPNDAPARGLGRFVVSGTELGGAVQHDVKIYSTTARDVRLVTRDSSFRPSCRHKVV